MLLYKSLDLLDLQVLNISKDFPFYLRVEQLIAFSLEESS